MSMGWKLQWAPTTVETARAAENFEYFRVDEEIVLIYAKKLHDLFTRADNHFIKAMTSSELEWLKECIDHTVAEKARKNPEKAFVNDQAFMKAFEKELAREKAMLEGKEDAGIGDTETKIHVGNKSENQQPDDSRT